MQTVPRPQRDVTETKSNKRSKGHYHSEREGRGEGGGTRPKIANPLANTNRSALVFFPSRNFMMPPLHCAKVTLEREGRGRMGGRSIGYEGRGGNADGAGGRGVGNFRQGGGETTKQQKGSLPTLRVTEGGGGRGHTSKYPKKNNWYRGEETEEEGETLQN